MNTPEQAQRGKINNIVHGSRHQTANATFPQDQPTDKIKKMWLQKKISIGFEKKKNSI